MWGPEAFKICLLFVKVKSKSYHISGFIRLNSKNILGNYKTSFLPFILSANFKLFEVLLEISFYYAKT